MALLLLLALLPLALPWRIGLLRRPLLHLVPLRGFPSAAGFSLTVAAQAGFARWPSSGTTCRLQWATWSRCCAPGLSISRPSMAKIADFLLLAPPLGGVSSFLHQGLSLDVVCGVPFPPPCHIVSPCPSGPPPLLLGVFP